MNAFIALFIARNKEFYRDKGSIGWALLFPILIITGCAIAFSEEDKHILTIGSFPAAEKSPPLEALTLNYSKIIAYDDFDKAQNRLKTHQLHALINLQTKTIWINNQSTHSHLVKSLMKNNQHYSIKAIEGNTLRYVDWVIPGVLGMNIMFGSLFGVGYVLVRYRKNGVLKRLQASPVSAFTFLSAQVLSRLFIVVIANVAIFIGADFFLDLLVLGHRLSLLVVAICGAISMIAIGLLIASRIASEELAGGLLNMATWPMMFLSGVWFSLDETPLYMQYFANCLPLTHLVEASRDIMINGASIIDVADHLLIMLIMGFASLALAACLFKWNR